VIDKDRVFIWPLYFDINRSRSEGRRIPRSLAINNPTAEKIAIALKKLGYKTEVISSKNHPSDWFNYRGLVIIPKMQVRISKSKLLKEVAKVLKELYDS